MRLCWLEQDEMEDWDSFQMESPRGHYCQLSTWLRSHREYGGMERILAARDESGKIVGGLGCISWRKWGIGLWVAPVGPAVGVGSEGLAGVILDAAAEGARQGGAMALLVQPAAARAGGFDELLLPLEYLPAHEDLRVRRRVPGMGIPQLMWIDFSRAGDGERWEEDLLSTFSQHARWSIRTALKSSLTCFEAQDREDIRAVFGVIEANGRAHGYATRKWEEFGETLVGQVRRQQAIVMGVRNGERLVGAHYGVLAGRRMSVVMAGTVRTEGSLSVGHFTHWMAIKKAHERNLLGYDFTSEGSAGVNQFKTGFRPEVIKFVPPQQLVFRPLRYRAWVKLLPTVQKHTRLLATVTRRHRVLAPKGK